MEGLRAMRPRHNLEQSMISLHDRPFAIAADLDDGATGSVRNGGAFFWASADGRV